MPQVANAEMIPLNRYEIVNPIDEGASLFSAHVYDMQEDRFVFIKTIDPTKKNARQRLLREADVLESLDHPQIPHLIDVECGEEFQYIVTEPKPGSSSVAERLKKNGPKSSAVARLCLSALDVLGYVHEEGFIHRDVKTSNLVMQYSGSVSLVDFELARHYRGVFGDMPAFGTANRPQRLEDTEITAHDSVAGTSGYMAPEQMLSMMAAPQSDIYGIGSMLHELLSGRLPFIYEGETKVKTDELAARKMEPNEDYFWQTGRHIPDALKFIAEKAMQPNINNRYAEAAEMAEDLQRFLANPRSVILKASTPVRTDPDPEIKLADDMQTESYITLPRLAVA